MWTEVEDRLSDSTALHRAVPAAQLKTNMLRNLLTELLCQQISRLPLLAIRWSAPDPANRQTDVQRRDSELITSGEEDVEL